VAGPVDQGDANAPFVAKGFELAQCLCREAQTLCHSHRRRDVLKEPQRDGPVGLVVDALSDVERVASDGFTGRDRQSGVPADGNIAQLLCPVRHRQRLPDRSARLTDAPPQKPIPRHRIDEPQRQIGITESDRGFQGAPQIWRFQS